MVPLSKLHKHISVPIWYFSIFIFFIGAIWLMQRILLSENKERILSKSFYLFAILLTLRFLLSVIQRVQSDALVLILLALFIFSLFFKKELTSGVFLASAAMVKLTPLIFLPYLLIRKRFKAALSCSITIVFYLFLPAVYLGLQKNFQYLQNWFMVHQKNPADYIFWYKNQSLFSCLARFLIKDSPVSILNLDLKTVFFIFSIIAIILFLLIFILCKKRPADKNGPLFLTEISLVLICMVLFSPLGWKHTFLNLLIPHMVLLYYLFYIDPGDKPVKVLLITSFILNTVLNPELTKPVAQLIQLYSSITLGTLFLYAALLRIQYKICKR